MALPHRVKQLALTVGLSALFAVSTLIIDKWGGEAMPPAAKSLQKQSAPSSHKAASPIKKLDYGHYTIWLDCRVRGAVRFYYKATRDVGNEKRHSRFYLDGNVPKDCQQFNASTYKKKGQRYDRGHLVPANHLDHSKTAIKTSNYMANIIPQHANVNRGAWLLTEEITECYRDISPLTVFGGVIYGTTPEDDYFIKSHGIPTPEAMWKVIQREGDAIAWLVPNSDQASRKRLDDYLVSISELEQRVGLKMAIPEQLKGVRPARSWPLPRGCNKG